MSLIPEQFFKKDRVLPKLFHVDGFRWADIHAGLAIDTHVLVDFCLIILHGDCRCGAFAHAGFTSGAFIVINDCYQLVHSFYMFLLLVKKGLLLRSPPVRAWNC